MAKRFSLPSSPLPGWRDAKEQLERWLLREALERSGGSISAAARELGVTKVAIWHAVRRHGLVDLTRRAA